MSPGRGREMKGLGNTQLIANVHSTAPKEVRFSSVPGHGAKRGAPEVGRAHKLALS